uniref:LIN-9 C-terminal domain-containing protein n=1 Tax=Ditylenchus dipsaci TaxID=166011 RepID=A0A915EN61_9BILA
MSHLYPTPNFIAADGNKSRSVVVMGLPDGNVVPAYSFQQKKVSLGKDEKYKKQLVSNLTWMNDSAEKMNLLANEYPHEFKMQYSQLVLDVELINKLFKTYLSAIQGYHGTLLPHLNEPQPADRPENLRKTCYTHAFQIVKHCNAELEVHVKNKRVLQLITALISIILQLRAIGSNQKKRYSACEWNVLSESLNQIRSQIRAKNTAQFQDCVEVHMKQIHKMMMK